MENIHVSDGCRHTGDPVGRAEAVTAALNLILAEAGAEGGSDLDYLMGKLSTYADQIQEALQVE